MTSGSTELLSKLSAQHELLMSLMREVSSASPDSRASAFRRFTQVLAVHDAVEHEFVHAVVGTVGVTASAAAALQSIDEEAAVVSAVAQLENLDLESEDFMVQFGTLSDLLQRHFRHEEHAEFPALALLDSPGCAVIEAGVDAALEHLQTRYSDRAPYEHQREAARAMLRGEIALRPSG